MAVQEAAPLERWLAALTSTLTRQRAQPAQFQALFEGRPLGCLGPHAMPHEAASAVWRRAGVAALAWELQAPDGRALAWLAAPGPRERAWRFHLQDR